VHYRIIWQHPGDLRGVALFQNANGHEYIYPESGGGRRVLPDWNTLSAVHNANLQLAIRGVYVQSLHGEHIHHLLHLVDFSAHHVRGSIYSGMPPDFLATISNSAYCQSGLSDCLVNFSGPHAARDPLCQHCGAGGWHQLLVQHNVARCVQEAFGHHLGCHQVNCRHTIAAHVAGPHAPSGGTCNPGNLAICASPMRFTDNSCTYTDNKKQTAATAQINVEQQFRSQR